MAHSINGFGLNHADRTQRRTGAQAHAISAFPRQVAPCKHDGDRRYPNDDLEQVTNA